MAPGQAIHEADGEPNTRADDETVAEGPLPPALPGAATDGRSSQGTGEEPSEVAGEGVGGVPSERAGEGAGGVPSERAGEGWSSRIVGPGPSPSSKWRVLHRSPGPPACGPDVASDDEAYRNWLRRRYGDGADRVAPSLPGRQSARGLFRRSAEGGPPRGARGEGAPTVDFVMLVAIASPDREALERMVASLLAQDHERWRLIAACDKHSAASFSRIRKSVPRGLRKSHLLVVPCPDGTPRPRAIALAARQVLGETGSADRLVGVIGEHDVLARQAMSMTAEAADAARSKRGGSLPLVVYTDEDEIGEDGLPRAPKLKPGWSPDFLLAWNYAGRLLFVREDHFVRAVLPTLDAAPGDEEDWEHVLALAACFDEAALGDPAAVLHVPEVLCHREPARAPELREGSWCASQVARAAHSLERNGAHGDVPPDDQVEVQGALTGEGAEAGVAGDAAPRGFTERTSGHPRWVVRWQPSRGPLVSAIIPFRDGARLLRNCLESIRATTDGVDLELLLVDNDSAEPETAALLGRLASWPKVRILEHPGKFNWAAINNEAARQARGEVLAFLNDDLEALEQGWLEALVGHAMRKDVGAVGARLVYPGGQLQHAGLVLGMGGAAGHVLRGLPAGAPGYMGLANTTRECSAVTGACMLTRRSVFEEMGGFDSTFASDLNDIDYCLRLADHGYRVVCIAEATLVHHESPSRGTTGSIRDIATFISRWAARIEAGDPYLSPHLSRRKADCSLAEDEEHAWWRSWRDWVLALAADERRAAR